MRGTPRHLHPRIRGGTVALLLLLTPLPTGGAARAVPGPAASGPAAPGLAAPGPGAAPSSTGTLERHWGELERQLRDLDRILPYEALPPARPREEEAGGRLPELPVAFPTLSSPGGILRPLSLEQAVAIAFGANPTLRAERQEVAAALAELQARLGTYWPRIAAVGEAASRNEATTYRAPRGNGSLGFGPNFAAKGLRAADGTAVDGPFFVGDGAAASLNQSANGVAGGLTVDYPLLDFARTPAVRAARERLRAARNRYANGLRGLQLEVSEAYYRLQEADQLVRIREADLRNDQVVLQDVLALRQAGLVPRLDELRRRAIEATGEERLIQAVADRAVARRRLAALLNLPAGETPTAGDPIRLQARWPLNLEATLLEAYRDNPELEAILATRNALVGDRDAAATALLPRLSLFAAAGASATNTNQWNAAGNCCGATVIPTLNTSGTDWSVGLAFRWLLFDAGTTAAETRALASRAAAEAERWVALRNDIRLRLEQAFFQHEASLARLAAARRGVSAALQAFRDSKLRYRSGLASEVELSLTQDQLIASLVQRLRATVEANVTYARLLRELLPVPRDPAAVPAPRLTLAPQAP